MVKDGRAVNLCLKYNTTISFNTINYVLQKNEQNNKDYQKSLPGRVIEEWAVWIRIGKDETDTDKKREVTPPFDALGSPA